MVVGTGRMWRRFGEHEEIAALAPGVSLSIPVGTTFQFRCGGNEPLVAVAATMPRPCRDHAALARRNRGGDCRGTLVDSVSTRAACRLITTAAHRLSFHAILR
ncbi:MAG: hypothetical protein ACREF3_19785 [Acetobacteraceae bacterium]